MRLPPLFLVLFVSASCVTSSIQALHSGVTKTDLDSSIRPADDFFRYVNGRWLAATEIPEDESRWGTFMELNRHVERQLIALIGEYDSTPREVLDADEHKLIDFYHSVTDTRTRAALGISPLKPYIERIAAAKRLDDLLLIDAGFRRYGFPSPVSMDVDIDFGNSARYTVYLYQGGLGLPVPEIYLANSDRSNQMLLMYTDYVERVLNIAGVAGSPGSAQAVVAFEAELAKLHRSPSEMRDLEALYNPYAVTDLNASVPFSANWHAYLDVLGVGDLDTIVIAQPGYFQSLAALLERTPLDVLKNYYCFQITNASAPYLHSPLENAHHGLFGRVFAGQAELPPNDERAVALLNKHLGDALGRAYVERHSSLSARSRVDAITNNVLGAFEESIDNLDWMSRETKTHARNKLHRIVTKVGYPLTWRSYDDLLIDPKELLGNAVRANEFEYRRRLEMLQQPVDRSVWTMSPQSVGASYNLTRNDMTFPAAILQPPFFNADAEEAFNYGAIGSVIGHEVGHAFDDQGRKFDQDGNLRDWWTREDSIAFEKKVAALRQQYDEFEVFPGHSVDGGLTVGENIGDLAGLIVGWRAYLHSLNGAEPPVIDGFTAEERYFIGYTQLWRWKYREEALKSRLLSDPHAPPEYRAIGPLMNSPLFLETYEVTPADRMYRPPAERVRIW